MEPFASPRIEYAGGFFMVRRKECVGVALAAFGAGLILAVLLQSGLCPILLGIASIIAGGICIR